MPALKKLIRFQAYFVLGLGLSLGPMMAAKLAWSQEASGGFLVSQSVPRAAAEFKEREIPVIYRIQLPFEVVELLREQAPLRNKSWPKRILQLLPRSLDPYRQARWLAVKEFVSGGEMNTDQVMQLIEENQVYSYVVNKGELLFVKQGPAEVGGGPDYFSKHVLLSKSSPTVDSAGELWKDHLGVIHLNNGSGTYRPAIENTQRLKQLLEEYMTPMEVITHDIREGGCP